MIQRANATTKELIQKSIELDKNFDWIKNLQKLINNIHDSKHRITGFTPNQIKEAYENDDKALLEEAFDTELKKEIRQHIKRNIQNQRLSNNISTKRHDTASMEQCNVYY